MSDNNKDFDFKNVSDDLAYNFSNELFDYCKANSKMLWTRDDYVVFRLKELFRNENSWVKHLSKKMGLEPVNNGWSGRANNLIFNDVINDLRNDKIKKGDLLVLEALGGGLTWGTVLVRY